MYGLRAHKADLCDQIGYLMFYHLNFYGGFHVHSFWNVLIRIHSRLETPAFYANFKYFLVEESIHLF
jgi:hypothetical protein